MSGRGPFLLLLGALLVGCADPTSQTGAQPAKGGAHSASGAEEIAVTTAIDDDTSLQIRSDGAGPYRNSRQLVSVIQNVGDWALDMVNPRGATRQVYLGFTAPVPGSGPNGADPAPGPSGFYPVRMISKCSTYGTSLQALPAGATMLCPLHIAFNAAGGDYVVQMNPRTDEGTDPVAITCTAPAGDTEPCVEWRISPSASGGTANVGKLLLVTTSKGRTVRLDRGNFYLSFSILISNP